MDSDARLSRRVSSSAHIALYSIQFTIKQSDEKGGQLQEQYCGVVNVCRLATAVDRSRTMVFVSEKMCNAQLTHKKHRS